MQTKRRKGFPVALAVAALVTLAIDQLSKALIRIYLPEGKPPLSLGGFGEIHQVRNPGTAFGIIQGRSWPLFLVSVVVFFLLLVVLWRWGRRDSILFQVGLGLIIGGAVGNIIDRVSLGAVVDFIDLGFWPMTKWPIFNLADLAIVIGVGITMVMVIKEGWKKEPRETREVTGPIA